MPAMSGFAGPTATGSRGRTEAFALPESMRVLLQQGRAEEEIGSNTGDMAV